MKAVACPLLALSWLVAAGCSSGAAKPTPGSGGTTGAAGASAGTTGEGGSASPDAAAGTGGGDTPDAAAGTGGGGRGGASDAGPDIPTGPGITIIQEDQPGFAAVDGKIYPRQGSTNVTG